jgi:hypothetical protein
MKDRLDILIKNYFPLFILGLLAVFLGYVHIFVIVTEKKSSDFRLIDTPTEATYIAENAWLNTLGDDIYDRQPFRAYRMENGNWHVFGTLPEGYLGGVPEAIISKEGKIIKVWHSK